MEQKARAIYKEFDNKRKKHEALQADQNDMNELKQLEEEIKRKKK